MRDKTAEFISRGHAASDDSNNLRSWLPASVREDLLEPMPAVLFGTGIKRFGLYKKVPIARSWNPWAPQVRSR